jgi:phosphomannomutase
MTANTPASLEKIFKAYDVRATYPTPLNEEAAWKVGFGTATFLKGQAASASGVAHKDTLVVGRDMRPHSTSLAKALCDGIRAAGLNVIDIGVIDTSMIYFAINHLSVLGGIQTTASHNPINYNGFKISGPKAVPIGSSSGLDEIRAIALGVKSTAVPVSGSIVEKDIWAGYKKHVLSFLDLKRPLKVVIDASNGMAGKMVPAVFGDVPGLTIVPILFEITGSFTHEPNPLVDKNLDMLRAKLAATPDADLGSMFDGDADRCLFLDETGKTVGCDIMTALLAKDFLSKPANKGASIVYDLRSSHVVKDEILAAGGVPVRDRVGHAFIKKTLKEKDAVFGGELSGHFYFRDNFYADSGAIAFSVLLSVLSAQPKKLSQLVAPLYTYYPTGEVNFEVEDKDGTIKKLAGKYSAGKIDYLDGITVELGDWWFNVRKSNTEPLLRLNLEAKTAKLREEKVAELQEILGHPAEGH